MNELAPVVHVIEDDGSLRAALTRLLRTAGFAVQGHASAGSFFSPATWTNSGASCSTSAFRT